MMTAYIGETLGKIHNSSYRAEALFYCEEHSYDYRKAKEAYDQDRAFEVE